MLDLHAHILPGIDDGPRNLDDAMALVRAMADDGIEHVVATPHIYPGVFDNTPARIADSFDALQQAMAEMDVSLTMSWAAEVRICPEVLDWLEQRRLPLLNGSLVGPGTVLIELPDGQIPVGTDRLTNLLLDRGITPLIAHPERNKAVMELPSRLENLRRSGCKFQLTAGSLLGDFGTRAQTAARALLDAGWVDAVATDAHNRSSRRPRLSAARDWLTEKYDEALATRLTKTQPMEIAGIDSFSLQGGKDRLVFRDLPHHMQAGPSPDQNWGEGLQLDDVLNQPVAMDSPPPIDIAGWSLTDFRIDSVLDDLNQASLKAGALSEVLGSPSQPEASSTPDEDWTLPAFAFTKPSPAIPSAKSQPVAPTPPTPPVAPKPVAPTQAAQHPSVEKTPAPTAPFNAAASAERSRRPASTPTPRVEPLMPAWRPEPPPPNPPPVVNVPTRPAQVLTLPVSSAIPTLTAAVMEAEVASVQDAVATLLESPSQSIQTRPTEPAARPVMDTQPLRAQTNPLPETVAEVVQRSAVDEPAMSLARPIAKGLRLSELPNQILSRDRFGPDASLSLKAEAESDKVPKVTSTGARMAVSPPQRMRVPAPLPAEPNRKSEPQGQRQGKASVSVESLTGVSTRFVPPQHVVQGTDLGNGLRGFRLSDLPPVPPSKRN